MGWGGVCEWSSELCDATFYKLAVRPFLSRQLLQHFRVSCWLRYRDDIFVTYDDVTKFRKLLTFMRARVKHIWNIKFEGCSLTHIPILGILVYKNGTRLAFKPYLKPSSRAVPLTQLSSHARHVCKWSFGYIRRLAVNSCCHEDFIEAKAFVTV